MTKFEDLETGKSLEIDGAAGVNWRRMASKMVHDRARGVEFTYPPGAPANIAELEQLVVKNREWIARGNTRRDAMTKFCVELPKIGTWLAGPSRQSTVFQPPKPGEKGLGSIKILSGSGCIFWISLDHRNDLGEICGTTVFPQGGYRFRFSCSLEELGKQINRAPTVNKAFLVDALQYPEF